MSQDGDIEISVVIPSHDDRAVIAGCLAALGAQVDAPCHEVIVVSSGSDGTAAFVASAFPTTRVIESRARVFPGNARNIGIAASRGRILAFTDADCIPDRRWLAEIARAHRYPASLIGGRIDHEPDSGVVGWASYFCDLSPWMAGVPGGEVHDLAAGCMSVKRAAFDEFGPFAENVYGSDTAFSRKLYGLGHPPTFDPAIRVRHRYRHGLGGFLAREVERGRYFGARRAAEGQWSGTRRALAVITAPAAAAQRLASKARAVARAGVYQQELVKSAPLLATGVAAWYLGQSLGYLAGIQAR